jgi:hypothetical protein
MDTRYNNPFPGMNPYLERPRLWPGVHNALIARLLDSLGPLLPPQYRIALEERFEIAVVPEEPVRAETRDVIPDLSLTTQRGAAGGVAVKEPPVPADGILVETPAPVRATYLEVREAPSDRVVTVVEVLSPTNKVQGSGRTDYLDKREDILASDVNLVEIDLLRGGEPMPLTTPVPDCHYRILVSRKRRRPNAYLFPFMIQDPIPKFTLPLLVGDTEPEADLGPLLASMHHTARYNLAINYDRAPPGPALDAETMQWVAKRVEPFREPE